MRGRRASATRLLAAIVGQADPTTDPASMPPAETSAPQAEPPAPGLTLDDVATELGIHRRTVRSRIRDGSLPARLLCGEWRISRGALDAFLRDLPRIWSRPANAGTPALEDEN